VYGRKHLDNFKHYAELTEIARGDGPMNALRIVLSSKNKKLY
jgi:hypothetical protein